MSARAQSSGSFRLLLFVGAAVSVAVGIWGVVWTGMLDTVLGLRTRIDDPAFHALARLFGGVMIVVGMGYALAAAQPHRNRGLLVPLFGVPFVNGVMAIAGTARQEIHGAKGAVFAAYNFAYCLLYFRLYPRLAAGGAEADEGPASSGWSEGPPTT